MDYHRYTDPMWDCKQQYQWDPQEEKPVLWTPPPANDNSEPIHVTRGLTPTCRLSVWLAGYMGYPQGWSLCGLIGLMAIVSPRPGYLADIVDGVLGKGHCYNAVHRSIDRVKQWAT